MNLKVRPIVYLAILPIAVSLLPMSCQSKGHSDVPIVREQASVVRSNIPLELVSAGGCLNVAQYGKALSELNPSLPLHVTSTNFNMSSNTSIRDAFRIVTAFATFEFGSLGSPSEDLDLVNFHQDDCSSISYENSEGKIEIFKIVNSAPDLVVGESSSGGRISYRWLSNSSVAVTTRYRAYDYPCTENDAFVEHSRILDWGAAQAEFVDVGISVNKDFLHLVAEAVGTNEEDLYADVPSLDPNEPARRTLISSKLSDLTRASVRPELLGCDAGRVN